MSPPTKESIVPTSPPRSPDACRAEALDLARAGARGPPHRARDRGITDQTLPNRGKRAELDAGPARRSCVIPIGAASTSLASI
jgi:hypothetical protein